jgi:hypothetical protein
LYQAKVVANWAAADKVARKIAAWYPVFNNLAVQTTRED